MGEIDWSLFDEFISNSDKSEEITDHICNMLKDFHTDLPTCIICGKVDLVAFTCPSKEYSEIKNIRTKLIYKRNNKFEDKLREIQGRYICPEDVINKLKNEEFSTVSELRRILKRLKLTKYNKYIYTILRELKGITLFKFSELELSRIRADFTKFERSYRTQIGKRNILGYNFIISKILKARGYNVDNKIFQHQPNTVISNEKIWKSLKI